ncbi:thioesterase II family protein [Gemmobacter serpentinus]|uniref:thioesterase II family protein n=1 Tax=Gemmobacter serpentinus TaxID=2652247 RepID=UPI00124C5C74|nr:alpha/beta fold hydrolase [Gemmobacter serpentinus]
MTSPWLIRVPKPGARTRLYVFPYAGGNAAAFLPWSARLGPGVELSVISLPGRGQRRVEAPLQDMRQAALQIAAAISADGATDFAFFGHSMGAVLALEVARICTLMHLRLPRLMVASGCRWPGALDREALHDLPTPAFLERLRALGGTPEDVLAHDELMQIVLPALRADFAMLHGYAYRPGLALKPTLHVFAGRQDHRVAPDELAGWQQESAAFGQVHWFEGGHFFLHQHEAEVLATLTGMLSGAAPAPFHPSHH